MAESLEKKLKEDKKDSLLLLDSDELLKTCKGDKNMETFIQDTILKESIFLKSKVALSKTFTLISYCIKLASSVHRNFTVSFNHITNVEISLIIAYPQLASAPFV